jgi:hypothetical protein
VDGFDLFDGQGELDELLFADGHEPPRVTISSSAYLRRPGVEVGVGAGDGDGSTVGVGVAVLVGLRRDLGVALGSAVSSGMGVGEGLDDIASGVGVELDDVSSGDGVGDISGKEIPSTMGPKHVDPNAANAPETNQSRDVRFIIIA